MKVIYTLEFAILTLSSLCFKSRCGSMQMHLLYPFIARTSKLISYHNNTWFTLNNRHLNDKRVISKYCQLKQYWPKNKLGKFFWTNTEGDSFGQPYYKRLRARYEAKKDGRFRFCVPYSYFCTQRRYLGYGKKIH